MDTDVVVIGAGLAGLTAAARLVARGVKVTVLDKAAHPGGRAITTTDQHFYLNLGPHAWFVGGRATDIMRQTGVPLRGRMPAPGGAYVVQGDRVVTLPTGLLSVLATDLLPVRARLELARIFRSLSGVDTARFDRSTVTAWLEGNVTHPAVRQFLAARIRTATYVDSPGLLSAGAALTQVKLARAANVWYIDEGWQSIVDALSQRVRSGGADLFTSTRARSVAIEKGHVRGVELGDGHFLAASHVILATPPDVATLITGGVVDTSACVAARAACLDLGLARLPRPAVRFAFGVDRPLYYSVHSATAALAPPGRAVIHAAKYLDPLQRHDPRQDEAELEAMMDRLQPGWRSEVEVRRFLPAMTVTFGLPTAAAGGTLGRPSVQVPGTAGLYLAGDWVGDEGQLANAAIVSAARAADLVMSTITLSDQANRVPAGVIG